MLKVNKNLTSDKSPFCKLESLGIPHSDGVMAFYIGKYTDYAVTIC